jgi:DNA-binding LacI/PurR family transcriptional regulator
LQCGEYGDGSVPEHILVDMADSAGGSDRGRERLPTIVEVASRAGVSIATVSRVMSGSGRVSEATRLRVEHAVAATGWTGDVAVVGFDDSPPAVMTTPALTTVHQPVEELAMLAVRTLIDPAGERPLDQRMPTQLVVRASSAA